MGSAYNFYGVYMGIIIHTPVVCRVMCIYDCIYIGDIKHVNGSFAILCMYTSLYRV